MNKSLCAVPKSYIGALFCTVFPTHFLGLNKGQEVERFVLV